MSYTIRFRSCNYKMGDDSPRPLLNGGVGRPIVTDLGLTEAERNAVLALLRHRNFRRVSHDDRVQVALPGGTPVTVHLVGLFANKICFDGIVVAPELTPVLATFAFDIAKAGNFLFGMENHRPFVITSQQHRAMSLTFPGCQVVPTARHLWQIVGPPPVEEPTGEDAKSPEPAAE